MKDIITQFAANALKPVGNATQQAQDPMNVISNVISAVIGVLGLACVVVIIVGGVKYMGSTGDPGKVKAAKDTILYGIIGLIVCVLAFAITNFVIRAINSGS